jgi:hypothetical protein
VYYAYIYLLNGLRCPVKGLNHDGKIFKPAVTDYLLFHSFYSATECTFIYSTFEGQEIFSSPKFLYCTWAHPSSYTMGTRDLLPRSKSVRA